jgi:hypothetical protein
VECLLVLQFTSTPICTAKCRTSSSTALHHKARSTTTSRTLTRGGNPRATTLVDRLRRLQQDMNEALAEAEELAEP